MKLKRPFQLLIIAGVAVAGKSSAQDSAESIQALKEQIQALDQKVRVLERQRELDSETAEARAKEAPRIVAGSSGLSVASADTNFVFSLRGLVQVDSRSFFNDGGITGNDSFSLRRARPIFQGTVFRDFDFQFTPDFGGNSVQIFDAYLNYRYQSALQLRAGKFKPPIGLEQLQSDPVTAFSERSLVSGFIPTRDIGFQLWGDLGQGKLSYAAGVFSGAGDARSAGNTDFEDHREFAGRIFLQPFKASKTEFLQGLGFGVGGSWGKVSPNATGLSGTTGGTLPGYITENLQQFFAYTNTTVADGEHWRLSPQASFYQGPFGLLGEYIISHQRVSRTAAPVAAEHLRHTGWQITGSWVLTGEDASYSGITPKRPFDPREGKWGAVQLVGRYSEADIDNDTFPLYANPAVSASDAQAWSVGLNWYLNKSLRVNTSFTRTTFDGGGSPAATTAPGIVTRQPEEAVTTRVQLAF